MTPNAQAQALWNTLDQLRRQPHWEAEGIYAITAALREAKAEGLEVAAQIAERFGVYPELNIANGGPEWYRHGQDIATRCRARAQTVRKDGT